jgi:hypothetical protein
MVEARGEVRPEEDRLIRLLRNSLEHLDEAELTDFEAMSGPTGNRSLTDLPGSYVAEVHLLRPAHIVRN